MAQFKRARLFTNLTSLGPDNVLYDEVWVCKLLTDSGATRQRYRIRYQRTDNPMAFGISDEEAEAIGAMLDQLGPAISCTLDVWDPHVGWIKCLDWMGSPSARMTDACHEINEQYKSFVTGVPTKDNFGDFIPTPSSPTAKDYGDLEPPKSTPKPKITSGNSTNNDDPDFDWI
tara:strand:- start:274 stop:792 length:519 start_codon:yes stop_codon:yes gene_type:complete